MSNHLKVLILSLLVLLILVIIYLISNISTLEEPQAKTSLQIKPINIQPLIIDTKEETKEKKPPLPAMDILAKLQLATEQSKKVTILVKKKKVDEVPVSLRKKVVKRKQVAKVPVSLKKKVVKRKEVVIIKKKKVAIKKRTIQKKTNIKRKILKPKKIIRQKVAPLELVKTLGIVSVSNQYESDFVIPPKVVVAREGIVNISTSSLETQEMKKLNFVNTLGVTEVSVNFETIEAKKFLP